MKRIFFFALLLLFSRIGFSQCLSGSYTIGGSTPDYSTVGSAVTALVSNGVCGPVIFNIRSGIYQQQIIIPQITGASALNTILFQSESGDSTTVTLCDSSLSASANYVVYLNGADYITFKSITLKALGLGNATVIKFAANSNYNQFRNNHLIGRATTSTAVNYVLVVSSGVANKYHTFQNNVFQDGSTALFHGGVSATTLDSGMVVKNNRFVNQSTAAVNLQYHNAPQITENTITSATAVASYYGINLFTCKSLIRVLRNKITGVTGNGISLNTCTATVSTNGLIANNMVQLGGSAAVHGIELLSSTYQNTDANSVNITSSSSSSAGFYTSAGSSLTAVNNIFVNSGSGYAYYISTTSAITVSDYNDFYSECSLAYWGSAHASLYSLQNASGKDLNSFNVKPNFVSPTDLHIINSYSLYQSGVNLPIVSVDIDGAPRSSTPCIGADEFSYTSSPLSGTYTVDPSGAGNYLSFTAAVTDLTNRGIAGNVIFNVANGIYPERIQIGDFYRSSATDSVIFQSASGDSSQVVLIDSLLGPCSNYAVYINDADYISFNRMTFKATGNVIQIANGKHIHFNNNVIHELSAASNYVVYCLGKGNEYTTFSYNYIKGGKWGIYYVGKDLANSVVGCVVRNNNFENQSDFGLFLQYQDSPLATSNVFTSNSSVIYVGIQISNVKNATKVIDNKVILNGKGYGIYYSFALGTSLQKALIANNTVYINGNATAIGMNIVSSDHLQIYYNSVNIISTSTFPTNSVAINTSSGSNLQIVNNIFQQTGVGYAIYVATTSAITQSDYNNFYSSSCFLGYWNTDVFNLARWQQVTLKDLNSLSVPVAFTSPDLQLATASLYGHGTSLAVVTTDLNGQARPVFPCIGAFEFSLPVGLSGTYTIDGAGSGNYLTFNQAMDDLNTKGTNGVVTFLVSPGTYNESLRITPYYRTNATDSVIFVSVTGDSSSVILFNNNPASCESYTLYIEGGDYVTFSKMTIRSMERTGTTVLDRTIEISTNADHDNVLSCRIEFIPLIAFNSGSNSAVVYVKGKVNNYFHLVGNALEGGWLGVQVEGVDTVQSPIGLLIKDNSILNATATSITLLYVRAPHVINNVMSNPLSNHTATQGITLISCYGRAMVLQNKITRVKRNGIELNNCLALEGLEGLLANNSIHAEGGVVLNKGIYVYGTTNYHIYHNSTSIVNSIQGYPIWIEECVSLQVKNNIFASFDEGFSSKIINLTGNSMLDYNDYYAWKYSTCYYFETFESIFQQQRNGMDLHSHYVRPNYDSATDLHLTKTFLLNNTGEDLSGEVSVDADGISRSTTPCIGAYEFDLIPDFMSGNYTIGPSGTYASFTAAFDDLTQRGVNGPVTVTASPGLYNEQFDVRHIYGTSDTNNITVQSSTNDSTDVEIFYDIPCYKDYVMLMDGSDHLEFKKITFHGIQTVSSTNARAFLVYLGGKTNHVSFTNCWFNADYTNSFSFEAIYSDGRDSVEYVNIDRNYFTAHSEGKSGGITRGNQMPVADYMRGWVIRNNFFRGKISGGVSLNYVSNPLIYNNTIMTTEPQYDFTGVWVVNSMNGGLVAENTIMGSRGQGIYISNTGTSATEFLIRNNMIQSTSNFASSGSSLGSGISVSNAPDVKVYHNSINILGNLSAQNGIAIYNSANAGIYNNTVSVLTGKAILLDNNPGVSSNHNDLYSGGTVLGQFNSTNVANLSAWQAASGSDLASISVVPSFVSDTNLHLSASAPVVLHSGTNLISSVPFDIDAQPRGFIPWMGADELSSVPDDVGVSSILSNTVSHCGYINDSIWVVVSNYGTSTQTSIPVTVDISGGVTSSFSQTTGSIGAGMSDTLFLGIINSAVTGDCFLTSYTMLAGDTVMLNDTAFIVLTIDTLPDISITATGSTSICEGDLVSLNGDVIAGVTYQWLLNGSPIPGAMTSSYTALVQGTYMLAASNSCGADTAGIAIVVLPVPVDSIFVTDASSCTDSDGSAGVVVSGGLSPFSYYWSNDDTTAVSSNLTPGTYTVTVTGANGCYTSSIATVGCGTATGISEFVSANEIGLYPNPNDGTFLIRYPESFHLKIYNLIGELIYSAECKEDGCNVNITGQSKGTYIVEIVAPGRTLRRKVIIH